MSKAEYFAYQKYPQSKKGVLYDLARNSIIQGYRQAEEDLKLTIEDIKKIHTFLYAVKNNKQGAFTFTRLSDEKYQEVLKRFRKYIKR